MSYIPRRLRPGRERDRRRVLRENRKAIRQEIAWFDAQSRYAGATAQWYAAKFEEVTA